jgi:hypothetical protein
MQPGQDAGGLMLTNIDVLDVCAVMLQRCGLSAEQLGDHMRREDLPSAAPQPEPVAPVVDAPAPAPAPAPAVVAKAAPKPAPAPKAPKAAKLAPTVVAPFVQAIARPTGEVIIPDHVVIQRAAPAVDTRMQVKPGDPLTGGFSTSRPGINPLTGLGWGVAA